MIINHADWKFITVDICSSKMVPLLRFPPIR